MSNHAFKTKNTSVVALTLFILAGAISTRGQQRSPGGVLPGPGAREGNRAMDDYDRTLNRMKNDAKAVIERRRNLFPQINEDFKRIQVIHNEMVRMIQPGKSLDYDRLMELTADIKKRSTRLKANLGLPESEKSDPTHEEGSPLDDSCVKKSLIALHDTVVKFVSNPIFKNLGVVEANLFSQASDDLRDIIWFSDRIKKTAETLSKTAKK